MKTVLTNADKAKRSLSFGSEQAVRPHSLYREVNDVRDDVERAFEKIEGKVGFPKAFAVSGNVWDVGGTDSFVIYGENLLAGRSKASASFASIAAVDSLLITSVKPGLSANQISLSVVAGGGALSVSVDGDSIQVTLADGGSTVNDVRDLINADADASLLVFASTSNNGGSNVKPVAAKNLVGGTGNGLSVKIVGIANDNSVVNTVCNIASCNDDSIALVDGQGAGMLANKLASVVVTTHTVTEAIQFTVSLD